MGFFPWRSALPACVLASIWLTNYRVQKMSMTVNQLLAEVQRLPYEERRRFVQLVRQLHDASDLSPIRNKLENDKEELLND